MRGKTLLGLGMAATLAGCAGPPEIELAIAPEWFECRRDRECAIVEDPRCGLVPMNERYAASFAGWVRRTYPQSSERQPCVAPAFRYGAVCNARRCSSVLLGPTAARAEKR